MKTVIFYSSTYNGNTLKIAESIAATLSADLIAIETYIFRSIPVHFPAAY